MLGLIHYSIQNFVVFWPNIKLIPCIMEINSYSNSILHTLSYLDSPGCSIKVYIWMYFHNHLMHVFIACSTKSTTQTWLTNLCTLYKTLTFACYGGHGITLSCVLNAFTISCYIMLLSSLFGHLFTCMYFPTLFWVVNKTNSWLYVARQLHVLHSQM